MSAVPEVSMLQGLFSGFAAHLGLNLREYQQAQTVIAVTVQPHHLNQAGNLHGGVIASLADTAMGMSGTWHADPAQWRLALTLSLNINYMAAIPPATEVRAVARLRGGGAKIFMASCDLLDAQDCLLASAEGVFKRGRLRAAATEVVACP
ncbi:PaaI family thioesterase [Pseudomonas protegens]|uniref:PaaI family thioesterase n=1 Tax=Pseudomonas protegens TaxID=380021 RepID=UPI0021C7209E|nr:PaaI family thioesterase [Pseudomonas protegens]MCU1768906.1 PaaI family thioesterase [Pseudomonas protegens]